MSTRQSLSGLNGEPILRPNERGVRATADQIDRRLAMTSKLLRQHAAAVLAGSASATMPKPMEAYVAPPAHTKPPTQVLFCLRSVKWIDDAGQQRIAGKFEDAE